MLRTPAATRAEEIALQEFGLTGTATPLEGERDLNFKVTTARQGSYVLKLHHPSAHGAELDLQNAVLLHLADHGISAAPQLIPTVRGPWMAEAEWFGDQRAVRLLSWTDGSIWPGAKATRSQMADLGRTLAHIDSALAGFEHHADAREDLLWRITAAPQMAPFISLVEPELRSAVVRALADYEGRVERRLSELPWQVVHHDANENNIVMGRSGGVAGLIDFGDVARVPRVTEVAIASAYAMQDRGDPITAILPLIAGYDSVVPLTIGEIDVLVDLVRVRLAMSVCMAAHQLAEAPDNAYLGVSQSGVRDALLKADALDRELATFRIRDIVGFEPDPASRILQQRFRSGELEPAAIIEPRPKSQLDEPPQAYGQSLPGGLISLQRTVRAAAGSEARAALAGAVYEIRSDEVVVAHTSGGAPFWSSVRGIKPREDRRVGDVVAQGDLLGVVSESRSGEPFVGVQLYTHEAALTRSSREASPEEQADLWRSLSPDPNLLLRDPAARHVVPARTIDELIQRRSTNFSRAMDISYNEPLHIVRGSGAYLFDRQGHEFLDLVNNVCHVGHAHPRVVEAAHRQAQQLNTNTRYLHDSVVEYARRITALMPDPLRVCFFVNSGSEANDLALRLAMAHTGAKDVLVLDHAYHGHLTSQIGLSPYKFNRSGGRGAPDSTWVCELPDVYRGRLRAGRDAELVEGYAASVSEQLDTLRVRGLRPSAFYVESLQSCGGQIVLPDGYLERTFAMVREAGGVCIADEVQVGLGRVGTHFWGFEAQGVVPDIVTLGKPLGNGHPLAAVVTTPEIAKSFETGMEWFNTFGGNPVSAEVGLSVLDVLEDEGLQAHARHMGDRMMAGLRQLSHRHEVVGDVRGMGLFIGIELSHAGRAPAAWLATELKEAAKQRGVLLSTDGPDGNVIKIKPPMVVSSADCDRFLEVFEEALLASARGSAATYGR